MKKIAVIALFSVLITWYYVEAQSRIDIDTLLVNTTVGLIRGFKATDGDYSMFLGIPYGKVNESNPFGHSIPYPPFDEPFEAYEESATCPQIAGVDTPIGTLDCLHINVYVPSSANSESRLPVLVWIHGGGLETGTAGYSTHDPKFLLRHDNMIVVSLGYRLGPYGFMCLDIPEVPGNQGLKDQRLALRWIKNNIEAFGGDLNKMTLAGASAGGKSVDFHLHLTKEMPFRNYIVQSGIALMPHLERESDPTGAIQLANILGFNTNDSKEALSFLAAEDVSSVLTAANQIEQFVPCYEKEFENVENFLTDYSINLDTDNIKGKNIIVGITSNEWLFMHATNTPADYATWNGFHDQLNRYFNFEEDELKEMSDIVKRFYIGDENISIDVRTELIDFESDFVVGYPCERSIDKYLDSGAANVYYYLFSYVGQRNWARQSFNITFGGSSHSEELGYLFGNDMFTEPINTADQRMIDRLTTMWANFVKYSEPILETSELLPIKWEPVRRDSPRYYLNIDTELDIWERPFNARMAFWELFYTGNKKLQKGYKEKETDLSH